MRRLVFPLLYLLIAMAGIGIAIVEHRDVELSDEPVSIYVPTPTPTPDALAGTPAPIDAGGRDQPAAEQEDEGETKRCGRSAHGRIETTLLGSDACEEAREVVRDADEELLTWGEPVEVGYRWTCSLTANMPPASGPLRCATFVGDVITTSGAF